MPKLKYEMLAYLRYLVGTYTHSVSFKTRRWDYNHFPQQFKLWLNTCLMTTGSVTLSGAKSDREPPGILVVSI